MTVGVPIRAKRILGAVLLWGTLLFCLMSRGGVWAAIEGEYMLASFSSGHDDWFAADNALGVDAVLFPGPDGNDRSCLRTDGVEGPGSLLRTASVRYAQPINLQDYHTLSYEIYPMPLSADPDAVYYTRLILHAGDGTLTEHLEKIVPGAWTEVRYDIGSWDGHGKLMQIEIGLLVSTASEEVYSGDYYIASVRARDPVDREMTDRFLFDRYGLTGASAQLSPEKDSLNITTFSGNIAVLDASLQTPEVDWDTRMLRLRLTNRTDNTSLILYYSTFNTPLFSEYKSVTIPLKKQSEAVDYFIDVGDASKLSHIRMQLGEGHGTVILHSLSLLPVYEEKGYTTCGSVDSCRLTADQSSLIVSGTVEREAALANQDGRLELFVLGDDLEGETEILESLIDTGCLAEGPMSTRFELKLSIAGLRRELLEQRFAAAIHSSDGSYTLIGAPVYLENPEIAAGASYILGTNKKGVGSSDLSLVGEADAGMALLELDAYAAFSGKEGAIRYEYQNRNYYFNADVMNRLAAQIAALGRQTDGILRLRGMNDERFETLSARYALDGYVNYSDYNSLADGEAYFGALCAYLAERWYADGSLKGMIVGEAENYMYAGCRSLNDTASLAAGYVRKAVYTLSGVNRDVKIWLSVSDLWSADKATAMREIGLEEFLPALLAELNGQDGWGLCVDISYRLGEDPGELLTPYESAKLTGLLADLRPDIRLLFCDSEYEFPRMKAEDMTAQYVLGYFASLAGPAIDGYLAELAAGSEGEKMAACIRSLGSADGKIYEEEALKTLGIRSFSELLEGFDPAAVSGLAHQTARALEGEPSGIRGRFRYIEFTSFSQSAGFLPGYYCREMKVVSDGSRMALTARLDPELYGEKLTPAAMSLVLPLEYPENLTLTPLLALRLKAEGAPENVQIELCLTSGDVIWEAGAEIPTGEYATVVFDCSGFTGAADTTGLQIRVRGCASPITLSMESLTGLSKEYNDESLEMLIAEERARKRSPEKEQPYQMAFWFGAALLIVAATILTVILLSRKHQKQTHSR